MIAVRTDDARYSNSVRHVGSLLLILSVGVMGCSDGGSEGMGGSAGTGATGGNGGTAGGGGGASGGNGGNGGSIPTGCVSEPDFTIVSGPGFEDMYFTCAAERLLGGASAVATCLQTEVGLSEVCSGCYVDYNECVFTTCTECIAMPSSDECVTCLADNCDTPFVECAGFNPLQPAP